MEPQEPVQGFRSVHKSQPPASTTAINPSKVLYIDRHDDSESQRSFVFWEDIQQGFEGALYVRHKAKMVSFLRGKDCRILEPRRIAAVPSVVLDVIVGDEVASSEAAAPQPMSKSV
ncbi:hypothetical protein EC957_010368, partial [Mortierella hygrophila]